MIPIVEVVPYRSEWPDVFEQEALLIKKALESNCITIHHIGSTSIPGLSAKPIIDILPVVKDILEVDKMTAKMEALGYTAKGEHGIAFRRFFQKGHPSKTHNVHVFEEGNSEIERHLNFRDWMRTHPDDAQAYARLKLELAEKFPHSMIDYCLGKDLFVANIDRKTGHQGWRMVQALTEREWKAVQALRQQSPLGLSFMQQGPDHIHFVFYVGSEIIGYAHLQLDSSQTALFHLIELDSNYTQFEERVLSLCERWLTQQGIHTWYLKSCSPFLVYLKQGYRVLSYDECKNKLVFSDDHPNLQIFVKHLNQLV